MARPRTHLVVEDHPSPRLKGKVRLYQKRRGPDDFLWGAHFLVDGKWTPKTPVSLGTTDWEEAKEIARDKFAVVTAGHPIGARSHKVEDHTFDRYARVAIAALRSQAEAAKLVASGKEHNFLDLARRIEKVLVPAFGAMQIARIDDDVLNDWAASYRVIDPAATTARYGKQKRGPDRQVVMKPPKYTTLGNVDRAFLKVWAAAAEAKIVSKRARPMIDKDEYGEHGEPRAFIDQRGCQAVYQVMKTEKWLYSDNGHSTDYKRLLRAYIALLATAGFRPGLELKRTMIGDVTARRQEGVDVILILVRKNAGKHKPERNTAVYEGDVFPTREWLANLLDWQEKRGCQLTSKLFSWDDGSIERCPNFGPGLTDVLEEAHMLVDPMTGDERVPYSFRHYFATMLIDKGLPTAKIAEWMGTSEDMIELHYNRWLIERNAHLFNGAGAADQSVAKSLRASPKMQRMRQRLLNEPPEEHPEMDDTAG